MKKVLIAYKYIPQYRAPFFEMLRTRLAEDDIEITLVYGDPNEYESKKKDASQIPWAQYRKNKLFSLGRRTLVYQPIFKLSKGYDLIIVEQASRLLVNPLLVLFTKLGLRKLAFWGHGKDFQRKESVLATWLKQIQSKNVWWWFAYNETSARVVREMGYPADRITSVMNTIDSGSLQRHLESITPEEIQGVKDRLALTTDQVCIYVGGLYDEKRLDFLMEAGSRIRELIPDFRLVVLGSGVERSKVEEFAKTHSWLSYEGSKFEREKAAYLKVSKLFLMPGLVGLAIIDTFVAQVPIVTTDISYHSPEIEYLESGKNGVMVKDANSVEEYAQQVARLLKDDATLEQLRVGCAVAAAKYTMKEMVERSAEGIRKALAI